MSRNSDLGLHFYMVECDKKGIVKEGAIEKDLELDFQGMLYCLAEGLTTLGKPRIYTESFADSDRTNVYIPENITREATTVVFTFLFTGADRYKVYNDFVEYVSNGFHRYYDTYREKYLYFFVSESIQISESEEYGSGPYLKLELNVQNIFGKTFDEPIK